VCDGEQSYMIDTSWDCSVFVHPSCALVESLFSRHCTEGVV